MSNTLFPLRKYWVVFRVGVSERLVYRADFFISTFLRFIPIITTILLWQAVYTGSGKQELGNLDYHQMVAYYLLVMITRAFGSMPSLSSDIATDIRDGGLRKYLLQPIDYLHYQITLRAAHKLIYFVMAAGPYILVFWMCRNYLPAWDVVWLGPSLLTLLLCFLLGYAMNALIGLLGFWFLEVGSLIHVVMTAQYFLSGHMFPLGLLPDRIEQIITLLPFAYETYYPTLIMLNKLDAYATARVIMIQVIWIVVLFAAVRWTWSRGLRRYAAYGG